MRRWWVVVAAVLWMMCCCAHGGRAPPGSCPPACACKWKGGKQTVECVDRALITVPEPVDPATQVLDLSGNNLQILPRETFAKNGLVNLQRVYLRNCKLGQIDNEAFKGLTNLVELDLSQNLLTQIPTATFNDVPFLRDLSIKQNPILKVHSDALSTLKNIVKLDLSHCEIRDVGNNAFRSVHLLESLKLNGNRLHELPPGSLAGLARLRAVELYDNPWNCDCRLRELKLWLSENNLPSTVAARCASPTRLADRPFSELHIDEFACKPEILPVSRHVEAGAGENATVACRTEAVPTAAINWYWNGRPLVNDSNFGLHQKIYIYEDGLFQKRSLLVLTNSQEADSGEFYCVAENKAGNAEANFTLHVNVRAAGMVTLGGAQIASLGAALFLIVVVILLVVLALLVRLRSATVCESKTPGRLDCVVTAGGVRTVPAEKAVAVAPSIDRGPSAAIQSDPKCNPVQKPPRAADIPYTTNHYEGRGSVVSVTGPPIISPTASSGNEPDLINDTRPESAARPGSGEYAREASDSLYPSGLWEQTAREAAGLARAASSALPHFYSDRTPIMDTCSTEGSQEELGYASKTFPRSHAAVPDYPADYGLPVVSAGGGGTVGAGGRTLRVWQRAPPVLPPVSALKRALHSSRSSPDEGYQEGCGTDV